MKSPYLSSGVISAREIVRRTMEFAGQSPSHIDPDRTKGPGSYLSEVAWRDFYTHVMAAFPRTSMGRPFLDEKLVGMVWETDGRMLEAWQQGKTGKSANCMKNASALVYRAASLLIDFENLQVFL